MNDTVLEQDLESALRSFEECISTPLVAGELTAWSKAAQETWAHLHSLFHQQLSTRHGQELEVIAQQDSKFLPQMTQLAADDQANRELSDKILRAIGRLSIEGSTSEPKELKIRDDLDNLVLQGLTFVSQVRRQETTLRTWLREAFKENPGSISS
jgi:hypothetical protein